MSKKVMVITGTRKGIGKYLAERYIKRDWYVIGCSRKKPEWHYEGYRHECFDVADEKDVCEFFAGLRKKEGRLDAVINNAGIASMNHALLTPKTTLENIFTTNVFGTFLFCRESVKLMKGDSLKRIINFSTIATPLRLEGEAVYSASKAAIENLTQVLARECSDMGIRINAIGPTPVQTDLVKNVPQAKIEALLNRQAIRRWGEMEDIANVLDFFLLPESEFITGQIIYLGGVSS